MPGVPAPKPSPPAIAVRQAPSNPEADPFDFLESEATTTTPRQPTAASKQQPKNKAGLHRNQIFIGVAAVCVVIMICGVAAMMSGGAGGGTSRNASDSVATRAAGVPATPTLTQGGTSRNAGNSVATGDPSASEQVRLPDFSKVDYSIPAVDYSKGPNGEKTYARTGIYTLATSNNEESQLGISENDGSLDKGNATVQGFLNQKRQFIAHGLTEVWFEKPRNGFAGKKQLEYYQYLGKQHGPLRGWSANGTLVWKRSFKYGMQHGEWLAWNEDGQKVAEMYWLNGKQHGLDTKWYPNGQEEDEMAWVDGNAQGLRRVWFEDGKLQRESYYVDGRVHGKITMWFADGKKEPDSVVEKGDDYRLAYEYGRQTGDHLLGGMQHAPDKSAIVESARSIYQQDMHTYSQFLQAVAGAGGHAVNVQKNLDVLQGKCDGLRDRFSESGISIE